MYISYKLVFSCKLILAIRLLLQVAAVVAVPGLPEPGSKTELLLPGSFAIKVPFVRMLSLFSRVKCYRLANPKLLQDIDMSHSTALGLRMSGELYLEPHAHITLVALVYWLEKPSRLQRHRQVNSIKGCTVGFVSRHMFHEGVVYVYVPAGQSLMPSCCLCVS